MVTELCANLLSLDIFDFELGCLPVDEWKKVQDQKVRDAAGMVRGKWVPDLKEKLLKLLEHRGKEPAYFNLNETDARDYHKSRLKVLLTQVSLVIADTFRSVMMTNTAKYAEWMKSRVPYSVAVKSLKDTENTFLVDDWMNVAKAGGQAGHVIPHDQLRPSFALELKIVTKDTRDEDLGPASARSSKSLPASRKASKDLLRKTSKERRGSKTVEETMEKVTKGLLMGASKKRMLARRP